MQKKALFRYENTFKEVSGEQCTLLRRTLESSPENIGVFSREHSSLLWRTFESSPENLGGFSEEPWGVL